MPLSDHEQRLLDQIEQALYAEDPKFASSVSSKRMRVRPRLRLVGAVVGIVLGLLVVVVGLLSKLIAVGVIGFVLIMASVLLLIYTFRKPSSTQLRVVGTDNPPGSKKPQSDGFRRRMEQRFKKRFDS